MTFKNVLLTSEVPFIDQLLIERC